MTLSALKPLEFDTGTRINAGRPPRQEMLRLADLRINETYQRPVTRSGEANIRKIAQGFQWAKFSPVIVRQIPGAKPLYEIIDGQHRCTAALMCGYDLVPCYLVDVDDANAAKVFAAVNGTVTQMSLQAVFKAARAGGEEWALAIDRACKSAGVEPLVYPVQKSQQKPLQTMAIGALRMVFANHGEEVLSAALRVLAASNGSHERGFLTHKLVRTFGNMMASRRGWVENCDKVERAIAPMNLVLSMPEDVEARLVKQIGDGRTAGSAWSDLKARVADMRSRRMTSQMIAASLRISYADVERALKEGAAA